MAKPKTLDLAQMIAGSATGYVAVVDGIMDIRTVADSPQKSAFVALFLQGSVVLPCSDENCDCITKALTRMIPTAKVVPVRIEASDD